jgi:hypothetical protein
MRAIPARPRRPFSPFEVVGFWFMTSVMRAEDKHIRFPQLDDTTFHFALPDRREAQGSGFQTTWVAPIANPRTR